MTARYVLRREFLRLAALSGARVIYVWTHDSIGLGEDGPTHQPVEHLASLRAMPNMLLLRPADATETVELLLEDAEAGVPGRDREAGNLEDLLVERGVAFVAYGGWQAIDGLERTRGEPVGRPRIKLCTWEELLAAGRS